VSVRVCVGVCGCLSVRASVSERVRERERCGVCVCVCVCMRLDLVEDAVPACCVGRVCVAGYCYSVPRRDVM
jgi:hypothetical protein